MHPDDSSRNITETPAEHTDLNDVEMAIARPLDRAAAAGRFDLVAQLARELEARRLRGLANVLPLPTKTRRRGK